MARNYRQVVKNLKHARRIFKSIPEEKVNLYDFLVEAPDDNKNPIEHACKTIACAAGWLIMHPDYSDGGRWIRENEFDNWEFVVPAKGEPSEPRWTRTEDGDWVFAVAQGHAVHPMDHMGKKLGLIGGEARALFNSRSLEERHCTNSDKQVWLTRCNRLIARLEEQNAAPRMQ